MTNTESTIETEIKTEKIKLPCLNCGKIHEFDENSNEANGIFNVFCDGECEDEYAFKI